MAKWVELPIIAVYQVKGGAEEGTQEIDQIASFYIEPPVEAYPHPVKQDVSFLQTGFGKKTVRLSYKALMKRLKA